MSTTRQTDPTPGTAAAIAPRHVLYSLLALAAAFGLGGLAWLFSPQPLDSSERSLLSAVFLLIAGLLAGYGVRFYYRKRAQVPSSFHKRLCVCAWVLTFLLAIPLIVTPLDPPDRPAWRDAELKDRVDGYEAYLQRWPEGPHAQDAKNRIEEFVAHEAVATKYKQLSWDQLFGNPDLYDRQKTKSAPRFEKAILRVSIGRGVSTAKRVSASRGEHPCSCERIRKLGG